MNNTNNTDNTDNIVPQEVADEFDALLEEAITFSPAPKADTPLNSPNTSRPGQLGQNGQNDFVQIVQTEQSQETDNFIALAKLRAGRLTHSYSRRSISELLATPAPVEYLIDGHIQKGAMHLLFGESGCKKTFAALSEALSIACPSINTWCGYDVEHGPVIYLCGEGARGLAKRAYAWILKHNISPEDIDFYIVDEVFHLNSEESDFNIDNTIANIWDICTETGQKPALIVVDTLNRYLEGDENKTEAMTQFVNALTRLSREFDCATLTIHHCGLSPENKGRPRGSGSLFGACDIVTQAYAKGESIQLDQSKHKDAQEITGLVLDFDEITLPPDWHRKNGTPETSLVPHLSPYSNHDKSQERKKPEVKLKAAQERGRNTYRAACEKFGIFIHNDKETGHTLAGVRFEDWEKVSCDLSSAKSEEAQRKSFDRDRKQLLETDMLLTKRKIDGQEYYCLDLEAKGAGEEGYRQSIAGAIGTREYLASRQGASKNADAGGAGEATQEASAGADSAEAGQGGISFGVTPNEERGS